VIPRRRFVAGLAVGFAAVSSFAARAARATGGLDPELGPPPSTVRLQVPPGRNATLRVLVASGVSPQAFAPSGDGEFSYAGKIYRGVPQLADAGNVRSGLIATLQVESYLYGVVPLEIGTQWPPAALQAQAIVARTYALAHRSAGRAFDVVAHEGDQVWGGIDVESPQTNAAVDATSGAVVTYGAGLASVFYASCCGGHTVDARGLWGGADLPYLRGVDDPYCASSPDYRWTTTLTAGTLSAALGPRLAALGTLRAITLRDPQPDGRRAVAFVGTTGAVDLSAAQVRTALGARVVRSAYWKDLTVVGDPAQADAQVVIEGAGRGHGVGLCQWGARMMALQGRSARDIVAYYFPGTAIGDA